MIKKSFLIICTIIILVSLASCAGSQVPSSATAAQPIEATSPSPTPTETGPVFYSPLYLAPGSPDELFCRYDAGAAISLGYAIHSDPVADKYTVTCSGEGLTLLSPAEFTAVGEADSYVLRFRAPENGKGKIALTLKAHGKGEAPARETHSYLYWCSSGQGVFLSRISAWYAKMAMAKAQYDAREITSADYYNLFRGRHYVVWLTTGNVFLEWLGQIASDNLEYSVYADPYVEAVHKSIFNSDEAVGIMGTLEEPRIQDKTTAKQAWEVIGPSVEELCGRGIPVYIEGSYVSAEGTDTDWSAAIYSESERKLRKIEYTAWHTAIENSEPSLGDDPYSGVLLTVNDLFGSWKIDSSEAYSIANKKGARSAMWMRLQVKGLDGLEAPSGRLDTPEFIPESTKLFWVITEFDSDKYYVDANTGEYLGYMMHPEGWPDDIPSSLPEFTCGVYHSDETIRSSSNSGSIISYDMRFTGVTREDLESYAEELKKTSLIVTLTEGVDMYVITTEQVFGDLCLKPVYVKFVESTGTCFVNIEVHLDYTDY